MSINFKSQEFWDFLNTHGTNDVSLYFHIPFCEQRCLYCDFYSNVASPNIHKLYIESMLYELSFYENYLKNKNIASIFFGGGTPSSINPTYIHQIIEKINKISHITKTCEITIECNPNSLNKESLKTYITSGINRISLGAQSFNDSILKKIGRIHTKEQIFNALDTIASSGLENYNIDLMLALPFQKMKDILNSIALINKFNIPHVSYYSLILEEDTYLFNNKENYVFPDENSDRLMYRTVVNELKNIGLNQYEISNFSKLGYECQHNLRYWKLQDYIGIGCSAQSNVDTIRYSNITNLNNYIQKKYSYDLEQLNKTQRLNEYNMLNLRLNSGIDILEANNRFNIDYISEYKYEIQKNINQNLIQLIDNKIILTPQGQDLANIVELSFTKSLNK